MRKGVRVSWVAAASVVTTSSGPVGLACKAESAASRSELERSDGELRSYGRQSHAGNWMLFSSGATYPAASASVRIAASTNRKSVVSGMSVTVGLYLGGSVFL